MQKYAGERGQEKWEGSDLILRDLATGNELNVGNVSEFAFNKKGDCLAWTIDAQGKSGNGVQLRYTKSGAVIALESDTASYKKLNWTEEGDGLAVLKGLDNKDYEEKLYSVIGFTTFGSSAPVKVVFNPAESKEFPQGMTISPNRSPEWSDDLTLLTFGPPRSPSGPAR